MKPSANHMSESVTLLIKYAQILLNIELAKKPAIPTSNYKLTGISPDVYYTRICRYIKEKDRYVCDFFSYRNFN